MHNYRAGDRFQFFVVLNVTRHLLCNSVNVVLSRLMIMVTNNYKRFKKACHLSALS